MIATYPTSPDKKKMNGGVAVVVAKLVAAMRRVGSSVEVFAAKENAHVELDPPYVNRTWRRDSVSSLLRTIARNRNAVIHLQHEVFLYGGAVSAVLVPLFARFVAPRARFVATVHGVVSRADITRSFCERNGLRGVPPWLVCIIFQLIYRSLDRAASVLIVHDKIFADRLKADWGCKTSRLEVLHLPLPDLPLKSDGASARSRYALGDGRVVGFFGYFTSYKGLAELFEAIPRVRKLDPGVEFLIGAGPHPQKVGDRAYNEVYEAMAVRAGKMDGVKWIGYVADADVGNFFGAIDLLVLPYSELLSASGPLHIAAAYESRVLCAEVLRPLLPKSIPTSGTKPEDLARGICSALSQPSPSVFSDWKRQRSIDEIARQHIAIYASMVT